MLPRTLAPRRHRRRWELLEGERIALADRVQALDPQLWNQPSRCEGWRVRDVLGHLVHMAESTRKSLVADLRAAAGRDGAKGFLVCGRRYGDAAVAELCQRLRDAAASRYNGMPTVALTEVVIHGDDMLQPAGARAAPSAETATACLDFTRHLNALIPGLAFQGRAYRGVRLVANDTDWSAGHGPDVTGTSLDLLALLFNRTGASLT